MIKKILWWGRFDENYSRNRVVRKILLKLGLEIIDFKPFSSFSGYIESLFRIKNIPDLVWVPCFRHKDVSSARKWSSKNNIPLIFDPLISQWDKKVNERNKYPAKSLQSIKLKNWEKKLFNSADYLISDTDAHKSFFNKHFNIPLNKIHTVNVGADEKLFRPIMRSKKSQIKEILFYGSFIELHGVDTILKAANASKNKNIKWTLLGNANKYKNFSFKQNIYFEKSIPFRDLPKRINKADILLGVFSKSEKANNVIPNKVYQAMACGKPVITRYADAYPKKILNGDCGIFFIEPENSEQLIKIIDEICNDANLDKASIRSKKTFNNFFSEKKIERQIIKIIKKF